MFSSLLARTTLALALGLAGALAFKLLHLPAAWLAGSMIAVAIAAAANLPLALPDLARKAMFVLLGVAMGAGVSRETLEVALKWPISLAALALTIVAIVALSTWMLVRLFRFDTKTALYASVPGALSAVLAAASDDKADVRRVAMVQNLRLFALVAIVPIAVGVPPAAPAVAVAGFGEIASLLAAGLVVGLVCERLKVPAGLLLGAMLPSAILHATGTLEARLPDPLVNAAFVVLGVHIGLRFVGFEMTLFRATMIAGFASLLVTGGVALVGAVAAVWLAGVPMPAALLAFAPGALEGMTALAFAMRIDPAFVGAHHLFRFLGIALLLPLVTMRLFSRA